MGRISRTYPKGRLRLRTPRMVQPDKKYPLYIEYNWQADNALHKRIEDIDLKIHKYCDIHQYITCDIIRSFLDDNDAVLRPDGGKDFIAFAKQLIESRYNKGKIGVSTWKNGVSYLNQFAEFLLLEHKGTHGDHKEFIYVSMENVIYNEMRMRGWIVDVGNIFHRIRNEAGQ